MTIYELIHFKKMVAGLKNQITIILFKIWPTNRFSKAKSYNFHFQKNDDTCLLVQMAYCMLLILSKNITENYNSCYADSTNTNNISAKKISKKQKYFKKQYSV